jgi:serine phosphatase RsbU (regulator of sigma subunit)
MNRTQSVAIAPTSSSRPACSAPDPGARALAIAAPAELAGDLVHPLPTIEAGTTNERVMQFFAERPLQEVAAVVESGRPTGLIGRHAFMETWARPFQRELLGRRGCETLMDRDPLVVDVCDPLPVLAARAVQAGARVLRDGFVAVRDGKYAGVGTGLAILEASAALEAARASQIVANVEYASLIQRSQLDVSRRELASAWPDHAIRWEPRDTVGGDCFLFRARPEGLVGAVLDCTGHGVSGAFMTLIALSALERALDAASGLPDPGTLLGALSQRVKRVLGQRGGGARAGLSDDGFDGACFAIPAGKREVLWAGARLPLFVASASGVETVEGSRTSGGYRSTPDDEVWPTRRSALPDAGALVIATDGVTDQVGGTRGIPLGKRRLAAIAGEVATRGAAAVVERIGSALAEWQGQESRRDDVTVVALGTGRTA